MKEVEADGKQSRNNVQILGLGNVPTRVAKVRLLDSAADMSAG